MKNPGILGAVAGDTIGSVYEFNPTKNYNFKLLDERMTYTDDSIMTIAVADWLLRDDARSHATLIERMRYWGNRYDYPMGGYGNSFSHWLHKETAEPYNSWGNGSAMRVSAVGFACSTLEETLQVAKVSAEVTHNHPEGIKGAQAVAAVVYMARTGKSKDEIREYVSSEFGYDVNVTCNEIRRSYHFEESCQKTVPESIVAFLDSKDYEDAIRLAVSLGGDADTIGAITGAIAAAYYKEIPDVICNFTLERLPDDLKSILSQFNSRYGA